MICNLDSRKQLQFGPQELVAIWIQGISCNLVSRNWLQFGLKELVAISLFEDVTGSIPLQKTNSGMSWISVWNEPDSTSYSLCCSCEGRYQRILKQNITFSSQTKSFLSVEHQINPTTNKSFKFQKENFKLSTTSLTYRATIKNQFNPSSIY